MLHSPWGHKELDTTELLNWLNHRFGNMTNNTICKGVCSPAGSGMIQLANTEERISQIQYNL